MKKTPWMVWSLFLCIAHLAAQAEAQTIIDLGPNAIVSGMSDDGQVVVGSFGLGGSAFRWTRANGLQLIGGSGPPYVSGDGAVIGGTIMDGAIEKAAIWVNGTNWQLLGDVPGGAPCDILSSSVWGINGDGSVIVGLAWHDCVSARAFRWDEVNGMVDLGAVGDNSRANGVSEDGTTAVGWDANPDTGTWEGARWVSGTESPLSDEETVGEATAANSDGSIIVGGRGGALSNQAYRWTSTTGIELIGVLSNPAGSARATDLSEDGNLIVGFSGGSPIDRAGFAWTPKDGMVRIDDYLTTQGVEGLQSWSLDTPIAVSPDKRFIAGWGIRNAAFHGFLVDFLGLFTDGFESGDTSAWSAMAP
ncbi:MAG: hypothetical protein AAF604_01995 [Acidobacteriota bacterium]